MNIGVLYPIAVAAQIYNTYTSFSKTESSAVVSNSQICPQRVITPSLICINFSKRIRSANFLLT